MVSIIETRRGFVVSIDRRRIRVMPHTLHFHLASWTPFIFVIVVIPCVSLDLTSYQLI